MVRFDSPAKKAAKATGKPSWSSWIPSLVPIITKRTIEFMHNVEKAIFVGSDEDSELKSLKSQVHFLQAQVRNIHATSGAGAGNNASIGSGSGLREPFQSPGINASSRIQPTTAAEPETQATSAHIVKRGLQLLELCETMEREGALAAQPQPPRVHPSNPFAPTTTAFSKPPLSFNEAKPYSTAQNFYRATSIPYDPANPPMPPPPNPAVDMKYDWQRSASANGSAIPNGIASRSNDSTRNQSIHPSSVHPSNMPANLNNLSNNSSSSGSSSTSSSFNSVNTDSNTSHHREVLPNDIQPSSVPNYYPTGGSSRYATYSRQQAQTTNKCCESAISNAKSANRQIHQQTLPRNMRRESLTPEADIPTERPLHNGTRPAPSEMPDEAPIISNINAPNENNMKQPLPISRLLFSAADLTQVKLKATLATKDPPSNNKVSFKRERQILRDVSNIIQTNNTQGGYCKSHMQHQQAPSNHGTCIRSPSMVPTEPSTAFHPKKLFSSVDIRSVKLKAKSSQNATNNLRPAASAINGNSKWNAAVGHQHRQPISIQSALREAMKLRFAKMHATPESHKSSVENSPSWD